MSFRIEMLWAFTQVDEDDEEGILGYFRRGEWMPLIASDRVRLADLHPYAKKIAEATGRPVKLSMFGARTDLELIEP